MSLCIKEVRPTNSFFAVLVPERSSDDAEFFKDVLLWHDIEVHDHEHKWPRIDAYDSQVILHPGEWVILSNGEIVGVHFDELLSYEYVEV